MEDLEDNRTEELLGALEADVGSTKSGPSAEEGEPTKKSFFKDGHSEAAKLSREDQYRIGRVNILDIAGWFGVLLAIWLVYTLVSGGVNFFRNSVAGVFTSETVVSVKERALKAKERAKSIAVEKAREQENNRALSRVENRLANIGVVPENGDSVDGEGNSNSDSKSASKKTKRGFSLGRAINNLLMKDQERAENKRARSKKDN